MAKIREIVGERCLLAEFEFKSETEHLWISMSPFLF